MRVVSLESFGNVDQFQLKKIPLIEPLPGEVRIRIKVAAFNPVDCKIRQGSYGGVVPLILGAECSGIIDAVGSDVHEFSMGDEVYAMSFGNCSNGSYAQYVCLPHQFVAKKPSNVCFFSAACIPIATLAAYRATENLQKLDSNGSLLIIGAAGGVGCMAVQLARHFHRGPIYTVARRRETAKFLNQKLGISEENILMLDQDSELVEIKHKLLMMNKGRQFAGVLDLVGKEMRNLCIECTDYSGVLVSIVPGEEDVKSSAWINDKYFFQHSLSLNCIFVGAESFSGSKETWSIYKKQFKTINQLFENNTIKIPYYKNLGHLSTETVQSAHCLLESGKVNGKLVMEIS